jgi:hypothetical protein
MSNFEINGLFEKLPVKIIDSPLNHALSKEEIFNKMSETLNNRNMLHGEIWDKFKQNTRENLHFIVVE